jgi:hypothetical protein
VKTTGHPDHTYVLTYPGGYCGEFLCYWLGQHKECVPVPTTFLPSNRYTTNFNQIRLHPRSPTSKLFLPGHNMHTHAAKNKFVPTDVSRVMGVHVSVAFQKFYFVLFAAKTILYRYGPQAPMPSATATEITQFLDYISPRTEFYHHEFDAWKNNHLVMSVNQVLEHRFRQGCINIDIDTAEFCINLDQLFFGSFVERFAEYQRVCDHVGTVTDVELLHQLDQYHARNLDLVSNAIQMSVPDFIALSNKDAWPIISAAGQRLV